MRAFRHRILVLAASFAVAGCGDEAQPGPRSAGDEAAEPTAGEQADIDEARGIIAKESAGNPAEPGGARVPGEGAGGAEKDGVGEDVTIVGTAANAKLGAVVVDEDGRTYYVDGLDAWDEALLDERVEVSGVLQRKKLAPDPVVGPDGEVSAGMVGEANVIAGASWTRAR